jgi:UDP-2,3-diacylglucosamine hydrolase
MIHGHTHRPAVHRYAENYRYVLSDWNRDPEHGPLRGDWLALLGNGELQRFNATGEPI